MILKKISADHPDYSKVKNLYETAFSIDERPMSMDEIMAITETMSAEVLGIYPDDAADDFSGFFVIFDAGDFVYLNFFATSPENAQPVSAARPSKPSLSTAMISRCFSFTRVLLKPAITPSNANADVHSI